MSTESISAFVAGATGYTGREVVRLLREYGVDVTAHVRPDSPRIEEWRGRFEQLGASVVTTPWEAEPMAGALDEINPDVVFSLLGTTRRRAKEESTEQQDVSYETVDYGLTALLIDACVSAGIRPRFVYLSAMGVSDDSRGAYMRARAKAERHLRSSGLAYTIARPSFITGDDRDRDRPVERLGSKLIDGALFAAAIFGGGTLRERYRSTTNTRLARALIEAAVASRWKNRVLESDDLQRLADEAGA